MISPLNRAILYASLAAFFWGGNFVVVKLSLPYFDPYTITLFRFTMLALLIPILGWPKVPFRIMIALSFFSGIGQYLLPTMAVEFGLSPGLAALFMQFQVFFSLFLSALLLKEQVPIKTIIGSILGVAGLVGILFQGEAYAPLLGASVCISAAMAWAIANIFLRQVKEPIFKLQAAISGLSIPIVIATMFIFPTKPVTLELLRSLDSTIWFSLVYMVVISIALGQFFWISAMRLVGVSKIAPITMLVPVFGMSLSWVILDEQLSLTVLLWMVVVLAGIGIHFFVPHQRSTKQPKS